MSFDDWFKEAKKRGDVPYGTAYETLARKAWEAGYAQGDIDGYERGRDDGYE